MPRNRSRHRTHSVSSGPSGTAARRSGGRHRQVCRQTRWLCVLTDSGRSAKRGRLGKPAKYLVLGSEPLYPPPYIPRLNGLGQVALGSLRLVLWVEWAELTGRDGCRRAEREAEPVIQ